MKRKGFYNDNVENISGKGHDTGILLITCKLSVVMHPKNGSNSRQAIFPLFSFNQLPDDKILTSPNGNKLQTTF